MTSKCVIARMVLTLICFLMPGAPALAGDDWKPVDPANLAKTASVVEKDADAEAIFWEVHINDAAQDLVFSHYIRIKVFTERGKESQSKIDITFSGRNRIVDIAGRTIKPDGSIIELKKDAVFERTIVKVGGFKFKAKTFAMPSVEPGVIIEYRWKEIRPSTLANNVRLQFQRDIPVQLVKYYLKPAQIDLGFSSLGMSYKMFNGEASPPVKDKDGFYTTSMTNVPALHEEPRMPPENQVKTWMLLFYSRDKPLPPQEYWPKLGREFYGALKSGMKVNDDVKKAAVAAIGDATTPEHKLQRLYEYCRTKIKNTSSVTSGLTDDERDKLKKNESPADTLKRGMGDGGDIDQLFAALATAAGFDVRAAALSDRSDIFFDKSFTNSYFLRAIDIAVRVDNEWRFFEPGTPYIPFGMIRWQQEAISALILDPKESVFVQTPVTAPEKTVQRRTGKLKLGEDGTLEGDVRIEYTGHLAVEKKEQNEDDSPSQREETLRDLIKERMSTAELSNIKIENATDSDKPFVYAFHIRVPGYAQRTGKRLFLQPGFFQKGIGAMFPASTRKLAIYFHYAWKDEDEITVELPAGFTLDNADAPAPVKAGDLVDYKIWMGVTKEGNALQYKRTFIFNALVFPASSYAPLKQVFDLIHEADNHTITLKQGGAAQ
jgi:Domain of Unknown Function with PDB structure (DUF3857)/Transglutaminase-like superfamily